MTYYEINENTARRAKAAYSFSEYTPGSATAEYKRAVDKAAEIAERQKKAVDEEYHEKIDRILDAYARKLAQNINEGNAITARVPSVMIAGPSNFPVRAKEKQNAAQDKNMQEYQLIQGLLDKIRSIGMGGISADDPRAIQKLQRQLDNRTEMQETFKAVNAYYRKNKTLEGCPDLTKEQAQSLMEDMQNRYFGRAASKPYESYVLSNNSAEIRRIKNRIEKLKHREEVVLVGWEFDGGNAKINKEDNRLQIFFDDKPDADVRAELKRNGFRWAPSAGAWQRQLNANAFYAADHIEAIQPISGEKPTALQRQAESEV